MTTKLLVQTLGLLASAPLITDAHAAGIVLLTDNFNTESSFTATPNADQGGTMGPVTYLNYAASRGTGALELGSSSNSSRVNVSNFDYDGAANTYDAPLEFKFDIGNFNPARGSQWVGIMLGNSSNLWPDAGSTSFSAIFFENGVTQVFRDGILFSSTPTWSSSNITLTLSNNAGNGSAFDGDGTLATVWSGNQQIGSWSVPSLVAADVNFAFGSYLSFPNGSGLTVDNLSITATQISVVPEPTSSLATLCLLSGGLLLRRRTKRKD